MLILKFGGSSVARPEAIMKVRSIIEEKKRHDQLLVVVSAFRGVTDSLDKLIREASTGHKKYKMRLSDIEDRHIRMIKELIPVQRQSTVLTRFKVMFNALSDVLQGVWLTRESTDRTRDFILGFGERFSAFIISEYLGCEDIHSQYADARDFIKTNRQFGAARVLLDETYAAIRPYVNKQDSGEVLVITGFIGSTKNGESTTIGRGGSDYTASLVGAAMQAKAVEIWSDVNGFMTADPRKVKHGFTISHLSYEEAMELSHFGAEIVYPPTLQPLLEASIPIKIKNTFQPSHKGTTISEITTAGASPIKGISSIDEITLLTVRGSGMIGLTGISARLFSALAEAEVNIIMITQSSSEHTICIGVLPKQASAAQKAIRSAFHHQGDTQIIQDIKIERDLSIVAVVGDEMRRKPGISGRIFQALGQNGVNIAAIAQGASERNISIVVDQKNEAKTLNTIHDAFFMADVKTVNLFLVGTGLIGARLLQLMEKQRKYLRKNHQIELRLTGISNSRTFLIDDDGISMSEWNEELQARGKPADINEFITRMADLNMSNSIFIDCTASKGVSGAYASVIKSNISIVTANKKANSSTLHQYDELHKLTNRHNVEYLYETNVGAGLPVIATLREQILAGDKIKRIEGVLSGTLSYIFNTFDGSRPFSEVVRSAKEKGFTEPDPREDLNGHDVGRKLLILAREAGLKLEFENIEIQNLVPEDAQTAESVDAFFERLQSHDKAFKSRYKQTQDKGKKLYYIARYQNEKATVKLEEMAPGHPFYGLKGSDNIVAFTTEHYQETPIVVKGPGAGANVTASGIIADILRISSAPSFRKDW